MEEEYDFRDNLVTLARFASPTEASLAHSRLELEGIETFLDREASSTALSHIGADLVGSQLLVRQADLTRARDVLDHLRGNVEEDSDADDPDDYDADDWSGEDWGDDEDDYEEPYTEEPEPTPPMTRAFRAAVIGTFLFPPLLSIYSIAIIVRPRLWEAPPGETSADWRFFASILFHFIGFSLFWWFFFVRQH